MFIKRPATWLIAVGALLWLVGSAWAQVPANSNLEYQTPTMSYENGSPPFAESAPQSPRLFGSLLPFHPVGFEPSWNWFGPAETSSYGNGPRSRIGFFGSYERVFWTMSKPTTAVVGSTTAPGPDIAGSLFPIPGLTPPPEGLFPAVNSVDTGFLQANGAWGNRIELGYVDTDNYGWMVGVLDHISQGQYHVVGSSQLQFNDPGGLLTGYIPFTILGQTFEVPDGKMATVFTEMLFKNVATLNGVELMRIYRAPRLHNGGYFETLYGARWLQLADTFSVVGTNTGVPPQQFPFPQTIVPPQTGGFINPLSDSQWNTRAQNNIVGPQIGFRFSDQRGHWITSVEGRFIAGMNFQSVHQTTRLGSNLENNIIALGFSPGGASNTNVPLPLSFSGLGTSSHASAYTFSPVGEIRAQVVYAITSTVGLKFGYTGLFLDNVTRASNRIDYSQQNLITILPGGTHQIFWAQGINMGLEFNR